MYDPAVDHLDRSVVKVLNNLDENVVYSTLVAWIDMHLVTGALNAMKYSNCECRGTYTSHVGYSATLGQRWESFHVQYDTNAGCIGLQRPGVT